MTTLNVRSSPASRECVERVPCARSGTSPATAGGCLSRPIPFDVPRELLPESGQIGGGFLELIRTDRGLIGRLTDVLQRLRDLIEADLLLAGRGGNLLKRLNAGIQ